MGLRFAEECGGKTKCGPETSTWMREWRSNWNEIIIFKHRRTCVRMCVCLFAHGDGRTIHSGSRPRGVEARALLVEAPEWFALVFQKRFVPCMLRVHQVEFVSAHQSDVNVFAEMRTMFAVFRKIARQDLFRNRCDAEYIFYLHFHIGGYPPNIWLEQVNKQIF